MQVTNSAADVMRWAMRRMLLWRIKRHRTKPDRIADGRAPSVTGAAAWLRTAPESWALTFEPVTLGRAEDNDIVLAHWSVCPYHAVISPIGGPPWRHILEDFSGDTLINGSWYRKLELRKGDIIQLGLIKLDYSGIALRPQVNGG